MQYHADMRLSEEPQSYNNYSAALLVMQFVKSKVALCTLCTYRHQDHISQCIMEHTVLPIQTGSFS